MRPGLISRLVQTVLNSGGPGHLVGSGRHRRAGHNSRVETMSRKTSTRGQWLPVEFADVETLDNARRLSTGPASWLDSFCYAWVKSHRGAPMTRRQLADWAGCSGRQAARVIAEVKARRAAWAASHPGDPGSIQPADPEVIHQSSTIPTGYEAPRSRNDPGSIQDRSDRGRGSTSTSTGTGTDQADGGSPSLRSRAREPGPQHARTAEDDDRVTAQDAELFLAQLHARRQIG